MGLSKFSVWSGVTGRERRKEGRILPPPQKKLVKEGAIKVKTQDPAAWRRDIGEPMLGRVLPAAARFCGKNLD